MSKVKVVVPWHNQKQKDEFLEAWGLRESDERLILQRDIRKEGCAITKNRGIQEALRDEADVIMVLDDDCYPATPHTTFSDFVSGHLKALKPQEVIMCVPTILPQPRGTPYEKKTIKMPVAASLGFWTDYPDLDAISALVLGPQPDEVRYLTSPVHGKVFPFCGMNFAFRREWVENGCAQLVNIPRWDDIFMGWIWEKVAYEQGHCFNFGGPFVRHIRQSNIWKNLKEEVPYLEQNETLWSAVYCSPRGMTAPQLREQFGLSYGTLGIPEAGVVDCPAQSKES